MAGALPSNSRVCLLLLPHPPPHPPPAFQDERLAELPDEPAPADAYMYNTHMGAFVRSLDQAKDHWLKAKLAFYAKRGSGSAPPPAASSQ